MLLLVWRHTIGESVDEHNTCKLNAAEVIKQQYACFPACLVALCCCCTANRVISGLAFADPGSGELTRL
jgi:hypothetical protein